MAPEEAHDVYTRLVEMVREAQANLYGAMRGLTQAQARVALVERRLVDLAGYLEQLATEGGGDGRESVTDVAATGRG